MSIRSELRKTSSHIITDLGYSLTLSRVTGQSYDSATGTNTETTTSFSVTGLVTHYTKSEIDGVTILSDDRKVTIKAGGAVPQVNDRVLGIAGVMRVVDVMSLAPDESGDMFYVCRVRA